MLTLHWRPTAHLTIRPHQSVGLLLSSLTEPRAYDIVQYTPSLILNANEWPD